MDEHNPNDGITDRAPRRWPSMSVTKVQVALLGVAALLIGFLAVAAWPSNSARAQGPNRMPGPPGSQFGGPPPFGGGMQQERKVLAQFDTDRNKRLDATERKAAREWLATQPAFGPGGRRGPGGRGFRGGFAPSSVGKKLMPADVKTVGADVPLYDPAALRTIFLTFEESDWEEELADFNNTDVDVPAIVTVDGRTYRDVGVHFRGMSSYFMVPEGSKRSLNLSFDAVHDKQDLGGYRTVNLLNATSDATFVRAVLYAEIARAYIPSPRMNYVRVVINGENWGVYLNAQQFNKDFLRDEFKTEKGARWKVPGSPRGHGGMEYLGEDPTLYKSTYDLRSKDDPKAWSDLIAFFKVLNETGPEKLQSALEPILDVDGALRFLALDVALVNNDGYWIRASDYSIYQDPGGRFHVIPHDMNEGLMEEAGPGGPGRRFGGPPPGAGGPPGGPGFGVGFGGGRGGVVELDPLVGLDDTSKPLRARLLAVPALRAKYLSYVREIAEQWLDWKKLEPIVRARQGLIAEDVAADTRKLYSTAAFKADVSESDDSLQRFVERRREYLLKATAK